MSRITKNKWIKATTTLATLLSSTKAHSIDLQSKIKNVDKSEFNTISTPFRKKPGQMAIIGEISDTKQPLILKQTNGSNQTLIDGLQAFELSFLYELTDSIQLGILVPGEKPYGLIGPYNEAKNYLSNILIEPKVYISDNVALIPVYYVPTQNKSTLNISGVPNEINYGHEKGAYGLKLSMANKLDNGITTAYQIGAIIAPESKFRDIDQTMKVQFGGGIKKELSGGLKLLAEAYGEKYKSNMPLEALAMIEYSNDKFMVRVGGGTGDIQGSGSNTTRVLANFSYYFGEERKASAPEEVKTPKLSDKPLTPEEYELFKKKVEKTEDEILDEKLKKQEEIEKLKEKINESTSSGEKTKNKTDVVSFLVSSQTNKEIFQCMMDSDSDEHDLSFLTELSQKEFETLFEQDIKGLNFEKVVERTIASAEESNLLARLEKVHVTPTAILGIKKRDFNWTEEKAKYVLLNLRRANLSLKENIDLYNRLKESNQDVTKAVNELNWGLRVFKRNMNSWNLLISSYMEMSKENISRLDLNNSMVHKNYTQEALVLLGKNEEHIDEQIVKAQKSEFIVDEDYQVIVASKLNIRKSPQILLNNIAGQLANGDLVRAKKSELQNSFVEVEVINSKLFNNKNNLSPLYVHYKYLNKVDLKKINLSKEVIEESNKNSIMDTFEEISKLNDQVPNQNFKDVLDAFKVIQNAEKETANKKANTIEVIPVEIPKTDTVDSQLEKVMKDSQKEVVTSDSNKEKLTTDDSLEMTKDKSKIVEKKAASKIEIVYEEEAPKKIEKVVKKVKKQLPVKVKPQVEVVESKTVETLTTLEQTPVKETKEVVEIKADSAKPVLEVKPSIEIVESKEESSSSKQKIEVEPSVKEEIKVIESKDPVKEEMDTLDKIIEMKANQKTEKSVEVIEVKPTPTDKDEKIVETKPVEVKSKSVDVFDSVIEKKTIELQNEKKKEEAEKTKDPSRVEPLKLQEDYPMDDIQKGPKF